MPYLRLSLPQGKSESEAQAILEYLRDNFPLKQSEGRVVRVAANFILFEQPEHSSLTLEQEVWLEKHGGENFVRVEQSFFANRICDECKSPIEDSPTGFCSRCYATNPHLITHLTLHFQEDEYPFVVFLCRRIWGSGTESPCLCIYLRAFLYLLEEEQLTLEDISLASLERFIAGARAYTHQQRTICHHCGLLKEHCNCEVFKTHVEMQLPDNPELRNVRVPLSKEEYRHLQAFAEQRGMDVETFALSSLGMSEVQLAAASREATLGRIFNCQMDFRLDQIERKVSSLILEVESKSYDFVFSSLVHLCLSLIDAVPLLEMSLFEILFGLERKAQNGQYLTRAKNQQATIDTTVAQNATPCTPGEIEALERHIGLALPAAYKEFLTWMGHGAGSFLRCLSCFYPSLASLQQEARAVLNSDACSLKLSDDAFVFAQVPGEGFAFLRTSEGDDPPVYAHRRVWRNKPFRKIYNRFSDLMMVQLGLYAELRLPKIFQNISGPEWRQRSQEMSIKVQAALAQKLREMQENR